jgi:hypothetical protein
MHENIKPAEMLDHLVDTPAAGCGIRYIRLEATETRRGGRPGDSRNLSALLRKHHSGSSAYTTGASSNQTDFTLQIHVEPGHVPAV